MIEVNHFFYIKTINCILLYLKKIKIINKDKKKIK